MGDGNTACWEGGCGTPRQTDRPWCPDHAVKHDEVPPWERCQECDEPLTRETVMRVIITKKAFVPSETTLARRRVVLYLHKACAALVFPDR
jgi:hypothetical protein